MNKLSHLVIEHNGHSYQVDTPDKFKEVVKVVRNNETEIMRKQLTRENNYIDHLTIKTNGIDLNDELTNAMNHKPVGESIISLDYYAEFETDGIEDGKAIAEDYVANNTREVNDYLESIEVNGIINFYWKCDNGKVYIYPTVYLLVNEDTDVDGLEEITVVIEAILEG